MSDQGSTGGDVWLVNANGKGEPIDITPGIDGTPCFEAWINDNSSASSKTAAATPCLVDWNPDTKKARSSATDLGEVTVSGGADQGRRLRLADKVRRLHQNRRQQSRPRSGS